MLVRAPLMGLIKALLAAAFGLLGALAPNAQAQASTVGSWAGPWDYAAQLAVGVPTGCPFDELSHAALIARGRHAGKVLLWRVHCGNGGTTEVWAFDPANPAVLIRAPYANLSSDIFCAGQSWDPIGRLNIAGGFNQGGTPDEAYRFDPAALGPVMYTVPPPGQPPQAFFGQQVPTIPGQTPPPALWTSLLPLMTVARYYPTVIPMLKDTLTTECTPTFTIEGGSSLILGGLVTGAAIDLWEYVQSASSGVGPVVIQPSGGTSVPNWPPGPVTVQSYARLSLPGQPLPDAKLDQYPQAFAMSTKDVLIVSDVESGSSVSWQNERGVSRVIRTPASTNLVPRCYELWRAAPAGYLEPIPGSQPPANTLLTNDRWYAPSVLLHTLLAKDRVLAFGGSEHAPLLQGNGWAMKRSVQEFVPDPQTSNPNRIVSGTWTGRQAKVDMVEPRIFHNAVILPTGDILIIGGGRNDTAHGHGDCVTSYSDPVAQPELYSPGASSNDSGSTRLLAPSNPTPAGTSSARLYHSLAVLLPDGRVYVAGGEHARIPNPQQCPGPYPSFDDTGFSAEIFYPPYLYQSFQQPALSGVPARRQLGTSMSVTVTWRAEHTIPRFSFLRPAAVTHHFDSDQRYIEAAASEPTDVTDDGAGNLTGTFSLTTPAANVAPPGYYMMFAIERSSGTSPVLVPSEGKFINLY